MCEGSTPTLPFCDAQGSENPAPPFITDVRSSSREAASQSSRSNFRAVTESLAVPFHHITHLGHFLPDESASSPSWLGSGQFAVVQMVLPFSSVHLHRHSLSSGTDPSSSCGRKRALPVGAPTEMVLPFAVGFGTLHAAHALASHFFPSIALG